MKCTWSLKFIIAQEEKGKGPVLCGNKSMDALKESTSFACNNRAICNSPISCTKSSRGHRLSISYSGFQSWRHGVQYLRIFMNHSKIWQSVSKYCTFKKRKASNCPKKVHTEYLAVVGVLDVKVKLCQSVSFRGFNAGLENSKRTYYKPIIHKYQILQKLQSETKKANVLTDAEWASQ